MASLDDLIEDLRTNPKGVRFSDLCKVADAYFEAVPQKGTSHRKWKMPWGGDPRINLQPTKDGKAKPYQVRQLLEAIDKANALGLKPKGR